MKFIWSIFLTLLLLPLATGADAPTLVLKGDVKEAERERTIIIKEKYQLVQTLPVRVEPPVNPKAQYRWKVLDGPNGKPLAGVTIEDDEANVLVITAAPKGDVTVKVRVTTIVAGEFDVKQWQVSFIVGSVVPPKPPEPPIDDFTKSLKALYDANNEPGKAASVAKLAAVWKDAQAIASNASLTTYGAMYAQIRLLGASKMQPQELVSIRTKVAEELDSKLPIQTATPMTDELRKEATAQYLRVQRALELCK
jgi:hypothetical protein